MACNRLALSLAIATAFGASVDAKACLPTSQQWATDNSDPIVEGTFFVDSEERGEGYVAVKRTLQGERRKRFRIRWDPHPELTFQPHELDCVVNMPASGVFEGFNLRRDGSGWYEIIGRWQRVRKGR
jgi:hypothetical protein